MLCSGGSINTSADPPSEEQGAKNNNHYIESEMEGINRERRTPNQEIETKQQLAVDGGALSDS